jgi:hypothetical protein
MSVDLSGRESARVRNHIAHKFIIHSATWTARRPLAHGREDGRPKDKVLSARRAAKNGGGGFIQSESSERGGRPSRTWHPMLRPPARMSRELKARASADGIEEPVTASFCAIVARQFEKIHARRRRRQPQIGLFRCVRCLVQTDEGGR